MLEARHPEANGLTAFGWFVLAYLILAIGGLILTGQDGRVAGIHLSPVLLLPAALLLLLISP